MQPDPERLAARTRPLRPSGARGAVIVALAMLFTVGCSTGKPASLAPEEPGNSSVATTVTTATSVPPKPTTTTAFTLPDFTLPALPPAAVGGAAVRKGSGAAARKGSRVAARKVGGTATGKGNGRRKDVRAAKSQAVVAARKPIVNVTWAASPKTFRIPAGARAAGTVRATNHDAVTGTVITPGCPVLVGHPPQNIPPTSCPPAGRVRAIGHGQRAIWWWHWSSTSNGMPTGTPLPPGEYTLRIGGTTVSITLT